MDVMTTFQICILHRDEARSTLYLVSIPLIPQQAVDSVDSRVITGARSGVSGILMEVLAACSSMTLLMGGCQNYGPLFGSLL